MFVLHFLGDFPLYHIIEICYFVYCTYRFLTVLERKRSDNRLGIESAVLGCMTLGQLIGYNMYYMLINISDEKESVRQ